MVTLFKTKFQLYLEIVKMLHAIATRHLLSLRTTLNKLSAIVSFLISFL